MLTCTVLDAESWGKVRGKYYRNKGTAKEKADVSLLSLLVPRNNSVAALKPQNGDLIIGRINRNLAATSAPALMLDLRGGYVGRCCFTELQECDDWSNYPLGRFQDNDLLREDNEMETEADDHNASDLKDGILSR
jgi:hypothetical protein